MATAVACLLLPGTCGNDFGVRQVTALPSNRIRFLRLSGQHVDLLSIAHSPLVRAGSHDYRGDSSSYPVRGASVYRSVTQKQDQEEVALPTSALAIAAAAASVSSVPLGFLTKLGDSGRLLSTPSAEFLALCAEQLSLCEKIVGRQTDLTVYVRTAESYATGQLEFFLAAVYPTVRADWSLGTYKEVLMLTDKSGAQGSISSVESALVQREALEVPEVSALVLPLVKDMFLVGFLVAERHVAKVPLQAKKPGRLKPVRPSWPPKEEAGLLLSAACDRKDGLMTKPEKIDEQHPALGTFTKEQQAEMAKIARTLALACVMDQRSVLLQQSSWQKGVRIDNLVEQVRGPLMAVRTLGKMLLPQFKRGEISRDVVEDILVQGDHMNDVVQQLQKNGVNSPDYDEGLLKALKARTAISMSDVSVKELRPISNEPNTLEVDVSTRQSSGNRERPSALTRPSLLGRDEESPMPPMALAAPPREGMRLCNVSEVLDQLVRAARGLSEQKNQSLQLQSGLEGIPLIAAIDQLLLRQALSNLLEYSIQHTPAGGWISAAVMGAPGGGVLVVIEDNGPDMGLVVQERLLGPLGSALSVSSKGNTNHERSFEAGLRLIAAREVLEQSNAVLSIRSPYLVDAPIGAGGTRIEIWLPQPADALLQN